VTMRRSTVLLAWKHVEVFEVLLGADGLVEHEQGGDALHRRCECGEHAGTIWPSGFGNTPALAQRARGGIYGVVKEVEGAVCG